MTLFQPKKAVKLPARVITTVTVRALGDCSYARAEEVFLSGLDPDSKLYSRYQRRLQQIWHRIQRMK